MLDGTDTDSNTIRIQSDSFDDVEILSPAPALFGGFGCSSAHTPIELTLATAAAQTSSESNHAARPFDFNRANLRDLTEELERTNWEQPRSEG